jgi:nitrogen-specific signal transduction histidine kinase
MSLKIQPMIFKGMQCNMLQITDLSQTALIEQIQQENQTINSLNATVTHEMMTPVNCISRFAQHLVDSVEDPSHQSKASLIYKTSSLLQNLL